MRGVCVCDVYMEIIKINPKNNIVREEFIFGPHTLKPSNDMWVNLNRRPKLISGLVGTCINSIHASGQYT